MVSGDKKPYILFSCYIRLWRSPLHLCINLYACLIYGFRPCKQCRVGTLSTFGAGGVLAGLYLSDWKAVVAYIPFYGGKFPPQE